MNNKESAQNLVRLFKNHACAGSADCVPCQIVSVSEWGLAQLETLMRDGAEMARLEQELHIAERDRYIQDIRRTR